MSLLDKTHMYDIQEVKIREPTVSMDPVMCIGCLKVNASPTIVEYIPFYTPEPL